MRCNKWEHYSQGQEERVLGVRVPGCVARGQHQPQSDTPPGARGQAVCRGGGPGQPEAEGGQRGQRVQHPGRRGRGERDQHQLGHGGTEALEAHEGKPGKFAD